MTTVRFSIVGDRDVRVACKVCRELAAPLRFSGLDLTMIATAVSTLARCILTLARHGEIELRSESGGGRDGIVVIARAADCPGFQDHLPMRGLARLMDDVQVESIQDHTTVWARKAVASARLWSPTATKPGRGTAAS
jgi:serine/threonine-protein kinase RsbT